MPRPRRARGKHPVGNARVHRDERVAVEDADQMRVPPHADFLAKQGERHGVERAADFDMAIEVDRPLAARKTGKVSGASGRSAGCSTSTKWVQTWRRVVP